MKRGLTVLCTLLLAGLIALPAQAQSKRTPSSMLRYNTQQEKTPGDGYMVAGDLWDTVKPMNTEQDNLLGSPYSGIGGGMLPYFHLGAADNSFLSPGGMWPNAYRIVNLFRNARKFGFSTFKADGWPGYEDGNPIYDADDGDDSRYMIAVYGPNVAGADDPARNYQHEARYVDESRTHLIYEAGWPTTAGIDFKLRAHQYTPNEQNINDFVVMEITLTNTGEVDSDGDGTLEVTDNVIDAVAASLQGETAPAVKIGFNGRRLGGADGGSKFGAGRSFGYVGADDDEGNPYDMLAYFANVPPGRTEGRTVPPEGERDFGINNYTNKDGHTDVWGAWRWMGVKEGSIQPCLPNCSYGDLGVISASSPDKQTLFGTHPIGVGSERGWYTSHTYQPDLVTYRWNDSVKEFRAATATWYEDYGRIADGGSNPPDLNPNSRVFNNGGTAGDVTTFGVATAGQRPHGDFKYASEDVGHERGIQQPVWEPGWNPALRGNNNPSASDFYQAVGYVREWTFGESNKTGVGPFRLEVGESITLTFVAAAGFRFEGIADAVEAADWAWERGWDIRGAMPAPPAPDIKVTSNVEGQALVHWTDVSGIDPDVDGYKVWRASQYQRTEWLDKGMRIADRFHHQHTVGEDFDPLLDSVNPYFDAEEFAFSGSGTSGTYQPAEWGVYELVANIPVGELDNHPSQDGAYDYTFVDENSIVGFTYWYYVAAYKEGEFSGPQGPITAGHLESYGTVNRNGRNSCEAMDGEIGLSTPWCGTYPFAYQNANYPIEGTQAFKNFGAEFTVTPPVAPVDQVSELITVTPNPYKRTGLNDDRDNASEHDLRFLNTPEDFTITILDVSGQIVFQDVVEGAADGEYVWGQYSKDGVEVASGLYIYHIQYGSGQAVTGHFAILR